MVSILQESARNIFDDRSTSMTFLDHPFPPPTPLHLHNTLKKHLTLTTLPHFISSKSPSKSFTSNEYCALSPNTYISTNKSILKKPSYANIPIRVYGSYTDRSSSVPCGNKKVDFKQNVLVIHFDKNEGNHVRSESLSLTLEPKNKKLLPRNCMKKNESRQDVVLQNISNIKSNGPVKSLEDELTLFKSKPPYSSFVLMSNPSFKNDKVTARSSRPFVQHANKVASTMIPVANEAFNNKPVVLSPKNNEEEIEYLQNVEFKFFEDDFRKLWLRFVVELGTGVLASDVLVKANLTGNKIRIVGFRLKNRGSIKENFNKRVLLPIEVDPYMVTARMDPEGKLFVEGLVTNKSKIL